MWLELLHRAAARAVLPGRRILCHLGGWIPREAVPFADWRSNHREGAGARFVSEGPGLKQPLSKCACPGGRANRAIVA